MLGNPPVYSVFLLSCSDFMLRRLLVPWLESLPGQVVQLLNNGLLHECSLLLDIMVAAAPVGIMIFGVALQDSVLGMIGEQCQVSATVLCVLFSCVHFHVCMCNKNVYACTSCLHYMLLIIVYLCTCTLFARVWSLELISCTYNST